MTDFIDTRPLDHSESRDSVGGADGRSRASRRVRDLTNGLVKEMGGSERVNVSVMQVITRTAHLAMLCERLETMSLQGRVLDSEVYGRANDRLIRNLASLGLHRGRPDSDAAPILSGRKRKSKY